MARPTPPHGENGLGARYLALYHTTTMATKTEKKSVAESGAYRVAESEIDILRATLAEREAEIERLTVALQSAEKPEGSTLRLARDADYSAAVLAKTLANCASEAGRVRVDAVTTGFRVSSKKETEVSEREYKPVTDREKAAVGVHAAAFRLHAALARLAKVK